jgi:hypothetical protein
MERRFNMFTLTKLSTLAAVGALVVIGGYGPPVRADELAQNLGPVGPHEPILTTFGNKRVIAFYEADQGRCVVSAVVWDTSDLDTGTTTAARVRVNLDPRDIVHLDSTDNKTITLQCGEFAESLNIVDGQLMTAGAAR